MTVRLLVRQRSEAGGNEKPSELLLDEPLIQLGRDKSCQVVLSQSAVSRSHARILRDGALYFIEDTGSAYGTQVNGKKLPAGEKRLLRNGDVIAIAQFDVTFERVMEVSRAPAGRSENTAFVARQAVKDVMRGVGGKTGEKPYFRFMNGHRDGERVEIGDAQELLIGRDEGVEIRLDDDLVSRRHAKVRRDWSGTHVEDLGSRNGIRVNRKRVTRRTLRDQDELEVGDVRLLYINPNEPAAEPSAHAARDDGEATEHAEASRAPSLQRSDAPAPQPEQAPAPALLQPEPPPPADPGLAPEPKAPADEPALSAAEPSALDEGNAPGDEGSLAASQAAEDEPARAMGVNSFKDLLADRKRLAIIAAMVLGALIAFVILLLVLLGV